jgi:hypothetical protein
LPAHTAVLHVFSDIFKERIVIWFEQGVKDDRHVINNSIIIFWIIEIEVVLLSGANFCAGILAF